MKNESIKEETYWTSRYKEGQTGWDIGYVSTPIKSYFDQLTDKNISILIPGAGNGYEAEYIYNLGFQNVSMLDISHLPLEAFKSRVPDFPLDQLIKANFFQHTGSYDLVIEQTFFCSFLPTKKLREAYAQSMANLIKPGGKLVGLWFDIPLEETQARPFGGSTSEYLEYLEPYFEVKSIAPCYNSIKPRAGKELFGIFIRK